MSDYRPGTLWWLLPEDESGQAELVVIVHDWGPRVRVRLLNAQRGRFREQIFPKERLQRRSRGGGPAPSVPAALGQAKSD